MLTALAFDWEGRALSPLTQAPWVGEAEGAADAAIAPVERRLAGDFFCAPFGANDLAPAPIHGWTANSPWTVVGEGDTLSLQLDRSVFGARVEKRLRLAEDAPILMQEHWILGGEGGLTVAHHPMLRMAGRGRFTCSPKRVALTPEAPLEPGRHRLACPARSADLAQFPSAEGGTLDLGALPIGDRHEDFVTLVEAEGSPLGWSAVVREAEDDIVFFLKDPKVLPVTMLWHSNAGRDYPPWNGRHSGVLGVEDGCAAGAAGHRAALGPNPVADEGVATHLSLDPASRHRVAHAIGALPRPAGWQAVAGITAADGRLTLTEAAGSTLSLPFDPDFF